jgi:hypothetical protein
MTSVYDAIKTAQEKEQISFIAAHLEWTATETSPPSAGLAALDVHHEARCKAAQGFGQHSRSFMDAPIMRVLLSSRTLMMATRSLW